MKRVFLPHNVGTHRKARLKLTHVLSPNLSGRVVTRTVCTTLGTTCPVRSRDCGVAAGHPRLILTYPRRHTGPPCSTAPRRRASWLGRLENPLQRRGTRL